MQIVALAGGVGGARFIRGLLRHLDHADPTSTVTVVVNTGDDITLHGLRVCPDLDTVMYTLGDGIDDDRGWGRRDETFHAAEELAHYGAGPEWFGLGDRDIATHLIRTRMLDAGYSLSKVTEALCARWQPGATLLPMSDDRIETHVVVDEGDGRKAVHFQEWWLRMRTAVAAQEFVSVGIDDAKPASGVIEAIEAADLVVLPPSNPVVSIGSILQVRGIRPAVAGKTVVGVSPIVGGAPVRGHADACLAAIGVETDAAAVARHYGGRRMGGLLDGWLVDTSDAASVDAVEAMGIRCTAVPLLMHDLDAAAAIAGAALTLSGML